MVGLAPAGTAPAAPPGPDRSADVSVVDPGWAPDPLTDGVPQPPSRDVAKTKEQQRRARASGATVAATYARDGHLPKPLPLAAQPTNSNPAPLVDKGLHDAQGVRMFSFAGKTWNHPVGQAQWGLSNLAAYRTSGDKRFLDRAVANAQRNIDRRVESRGASVPVRLRPEPLRGPPAARAPWYSGMAQGEMLASSSAWPRSPARRSGGRRRTRRS
ncbi:hypothetical protein V2I01_09375 [Micromonospora sp. BRA006-A]|nr:hypothetical protein [Micromonospora sp. BRA006-A]